MLVSDRVQAAMFGHNLAGAQISLHFGVLDAGHVYLYLFRVH
jgi:hypothetical protein